MVSNEQPKPVITTLDEKQKQAVLEDIRNRGGTFFTWEELQTWMAKLGPKATIKEVQEAIAAQNEQNKKQ